MEQGEVRIPVAWLCLTAGWTRPEPDFESAEAPLRAKPASLLRSPSDENPPPLT